MTYIYLPANASSNFYPKNTNQCYKTRVCMTDDFSGNWQVGLVNIIYPGISYNVCEPDAKCYIQFMNFETKEVDIPVGRYKSVEELIEQLNTDLNFKLPTSCYHTISLTYNKHTGKVTYSLEKNTSRFVLTEGPSLVGENIPHTDADAIAGTSFSPKVSAILGFEDTRDRSKFDWRRYMQNPNTTFTGKYVADLNKGIQAMYVYSDIMEACPVGEVRAPLLRVVAHKEDYTMDRTVASYQSFERIHYHKLKPRFITEIEVDIRDSYGAPIAFDRGDMMVTLHVRRAKSQV